MRDARIFPCFLLERPTQTKVISCLQFRYLNFLFRKNKLLYLCLINAGYRNKWILRTFRKKCTLVRLYSQFGFLAICTFFCRLVLISSTQTRFIRCPDAFLGNVNSIRDRRSWQRECTFLVLKEDFARWPRRKSAPLNEAFLVSPLSRDIFGLPGRCSERKGRGETENPRRTSSANVEEASAKSSWQKSGRCWPDSPKVADDLVCQVLHVFSLSIDARGRRIACI